MAATDFSRTAIGAAPVATRLASVFMGPLAAIWAWNDKRKTRNVLSKLSDRELSDIGFTRGDLD